MESSQNNDSISYIGFKQRPFQITIITDYTSTKHLFLNPTRRSLPTALNLPITYEII